MNQISENPFESPSVDGPVKLISPVRPAWKVRAIAYLAIAMLLFFFAAMLIPVRPGVRDAARRSSCQNNMRGLGIAMHNYLSEHGRFPPAYSVDEIGRPLHSWRVLILPYLEQNELYQLIDLAKPWDDPANQHARSRMPEIYRCVSSRPPAGFTTYLANCWEEGAFVPSQLGRTIEAFEDGTSSTILILEAPLSLAVEWMSPLDGNPETFFRKTSSESDPHQNGMNVTMADASSHYIKSGLTRESIFPFFTAAGGESVSLIDLK